MKVEFRNKLGHIGEQIPTKECLFVLVHANARTGKRMEGCGDGRVLGAYGRDELNSNGKRLLEFASDNNPLSQTRFLAFARMTYPIRSTASAAAITIHGLTTS